jgi:Uma2 family endonuclease
MAAKPSHAAVSIIVMVIRHAFTVDEWHRMGEAGLFGDDARMELLDGEVIEMAPIGSPHAGGVNRLNHLLTSALGAQALVAVQNPVVLDDRSEPQPDIAVLQPRPDDYSRSHPTPSEILLLIEVSDTTLAFDRDIKAPQYARTGVPEYWIVDLAGDQVMVMREPSSTGYRDIRSLGPGNELSMGALPGVLFEVSQILGSSG